MNKLDSETFARIHTVKNALKATYVKMIAELPASLDRFLDGAIISGGVTASLWHQESVNDVDVYLKDSQTGDEFIKFISKPENNILDYVKGLNPNYYKSIIEGKCVTSNAVTFTNKLQIITVMPKEHRANFDYIHCMPYYDIKSDQYFISENQIESIKNKKLIPNPRSTQKITTYRTQKFLNRGWKEA